MIDTEGAPVSGPGWWPTYRYNSWRTGTLPVAESAGVVDTPGCVRLFPSVPNPFSPRTALEFALPSSGIVRLAVYDVAGRRVTSLIDRRTDAGVHRALWDGTDADGHSVASGVYFVRLDACGQTRQRKVVLLR